MQEQMYIKAILCSNATFEEMGAAYHKKVPVTAPVHLSRAKVILQEVPERPHSFACAVSGSEERYAPICPEVVLQHRVTLMKQNTSYLEPVLLTLD